VTELAPRRIVVEATGGLETVLVNALAAAALPVVVVNPCQVRACAKAVGLLAKTDRLDAHVLAHCAAAVQPPLRARPDAATQTLQAVVIQRRQLGEMLVPERIRRKQLPAALRPLVQRHTTWLEQEVMDTETVLTRLQQSPPWRAHDDLLRRVPGVGAMFTRTLLAHGMELGRLNGKQMAALIGVVPFTRESRQRRGKRTT
jgi:transposase